MSYYRGALMERVVAFSRATGGYFCEDDFRNYRPEWVELITQDYRGYTVCEIPPNGHGITVLMALGILNGMTMPENRESAEHYHKVMEAIKLAFADTRIYVADPRYMKSKVSELLDPAYLAARRAEQEGFLDLSFDTTCAYGAHAAIIHYAPTPETDIPLEAHGLLLVDSGGHYLEGTTDITRTIALGPVTDAERGAESGYSCPRAAVGGRSGL